MFISKSLDTFLRVFSLLQVGYMIHMGMDFKFVSITHGCNCRMNRYLQTQISYELVFIHQYSRKIYCFNNRKSIVFHSHKVRVCHDLVYVMGFSYYKLEHT